MKWILFITGVICTAKLPHILRADNHVSCLGRTEIKQDCAYLLYLPSQMLQLHVLMHSSCTAMTRHLQCLHTRSSMVICMNRCNTRDKDALIMTFWGGGDFIAVIFFTAVYQYISQASRFIFTAVMCREEVNFGLTILYFQSDEDKYTVDKIQCTNLYIYSIVVTLYSKAKQKYIF